ncbi:ABC-type antimicrobial peptide transport syst em, ATPase component YknY (plasmid) [Peptoclostridium acidaminophilum DSM 3953]|uniref:ABC-type antimicrobial peptide transport syst em, ATPase component YknY n=1 Tax=Peptoclostridium acidaminophilum DSM 3953 TaxID=1286171 RepID=W8TP87_PEPAC|nr:ABC-type antimicrobial peptide transport syst em, ATPase component YknY [Peptoclostridium acidaminophilum DSM 3953]
MNTKVIIRLENIRKSYFVGRHELEILKGISLDIHEGEFLAILGPSGSGKSTLMNILGMIDRPTSGTYTFSGNGISFEDDFKLAGLRNKSIGFIFQKFNLLPKFNALENVEMPLLIRGFTRKEARPIATERLEAVGLADRMTHKPTELSGGQQQRVSIARALVGSPAILLADEPTGNLDSKSEADVMKLFKELNSKGITIILITHSEEVAREADRIVVIRDGEIADTHSPHHF